MRILKAARPILLTLVACLPNCPPTSAATTNSTVVLTSLAQPVYPQMARTASVYGEVLVLVEVRQDGTVASVTAVTGHAMLKQAAVDSAQHSKFECHNCAADAVYSLLYKFEQVNGCDCCNAFNVAPKIDQQAVNRDFQGRP